MLFSARGSAEFTVHLTYPVKEIDEGRMEDWTKEQKKKENRKKTPSDSAQPTWSPKAQSLEALFADKRISEEKIRIVDPDRPHLIDLLDAVQF